MEPGKKHSFNIMNVWREYAAKRRRTLSWLGFGPVADWSVAVAIALLSVGGALYYGWYSYSIESGREFVPQPQELQSKGLRRQVESAINFFEQRNAAVARVVENGASATTTTENPSGDAARKTSGSGTAIPSIR